MAKTDSPEFQSISRDIISLKDILTVFNNPLNEEQAWAVCHQCAKHLLNNTEKFKLRLFYKNGNKALLLCKDGEVLVDLINDVILNPGSDPTGTVFIGIFV